MSSFESVGHASTSAFADGSKPTVEVAMKAIIRPLPSLLEEDKVKQFMSEMKDGADFTPIEIMKVTGPLKRDPQVVETRYYSVGGCHRYEATKRLELPTIKARIINVPPKQLSIYLGSGSPFA